MLHSFMRVFLQPLELICEKAIATCNRPLGAGEALRRVMECLASGILLPGTYGFSSYGECTCNIWKTLCVSVQIVGFFFLFFFQEVKK